MAHNYDPSQQEGTSTGASMLMATLLRWPLLVLGMAGGMVVGFLLYNSMTPKYQSSAQIAVQRKAMTASSANDFRGGVMEDYVANQIDRLRSEIVLAEAARKLKDTQIGLKNPLPAEDYQAFSVIRGGLTITRSRESAAMANTISNVVNMSYKGADPHDTKIILQAIIDAYKKQLDDDYSTDTKRLLADINTRLGEINKDIIIEEGKLAEANSVLAKNTQEPLPVISQRITASKEKVVTLKLDIEKQKKLIAKIKEADKLGLTERLQLLYQITGQQRGGMELNANNPDVQIRILESQKKEKLESGIGKDHPLVKSVDSQLEFWREIKKAQDPNAVTLDALGIAQKNIEYNLETAEAQLVFIQSNIADESATYNAAVEQNSKIQQLQTSIKNKEATQLILRNDLSRVKATDTVGGFEVHTNLRPQTGIKVEPVLFSWLALGGLVGLIAGFGLGLIVELSDKSFRSPMEIRKRLGVPLIGHLPAIRTDLPSETDLPPEYAETLVAARRPKSLEAEAYRGVRTQLGVITQNAGHQVIQVTSPNPGDGKSTLAANLAISLAQSGKRVVLLDCDFRKPRVHKLFAITRPEVGLASVTSGNTVLAEAIRHSSIDNLDILPCGPRPANPAELLSGQRFQQVLGELRKLYDFVIVDTPPMLAVSDPRIVAQRVDGVILVFRITKKARPLAERAREQLADMGANLLGVCVNGAGKTGEDYGYTYGYNYTYQYEYEYAESYADPDDVVGGSGVLVKGGKPVK